MNPYLPLVWGTLCFGLGIAMGDVYPGVFYLFITIALLILSGLMKRSATWSAVLGCAVWMGLGASRAQIELPSAGWERAMHASHRMNERMVQRMERAGLSDEAMELCSAMALGNKERLSRETRQRFSQVGANHLLALSGMHLGILYALIHFLLVRPLRFSRWEWVGTAASLQTIWLYAFLAGLPPSLVRASIMLSCCIVFFRHNDANLALHRLALCMLIMWMIWPGYIRQIGFWLSICAVFFIVQVYAPLYRRVTETMPRFSLLPRYGTSLASVVALSVVAQVGTMPLSIYFFHTIPLLGALWSAVLIPLSSIILALSLLVVALPMGFLGTTLNVVVQFYYWLMEGMSSVPHCVVYNVYPTVLQVALLYALLLVMMLRLHVWLGREWHNR